MVDPKVSQSLADMKEFVSINMEKIGVVEDAPLSIVRMASGFKDQIEGDDYLSGISVGLLLAYLIIEYCEKKVN